MQNCTMCAFSINWLRRFSTIFKIYGWFVLQVSVTIALYGVYRTACSGLTVDCKADPAPMLMVAIPAIILVLENTSKRASNTLNGVVWETYYITASCLLISICADDWTILRSFALTSLMFILQSGTAVFESMNLYRRKLLAVVFSLIVLFTMTIVYTFGQLSPTHMLFMTAYMMFLVLTSITVHLETVAIRHVHQSCEVTWPAMMLYINFMLLLQCNTFLLTPNLWSARWDSTFSSLIAYFHSDSTVSPTAARKLP
ncbi:Ba196 [Baboon cytomegalovirus]|nr:Ba196 [Baboon cytomegalovirus]